MAALLAAAPSCYQSNVISDLRYEPAVCRLTSRALVRMRPGAAAGSSINGASS